MQYGGQDVHGRWDAKGTSVPIWFSSNHRARLCDNVWPLRSPSFFGCAIFLVISNDLTGRRLAAVVG